ncbi:MAG TPA: transglutaminase-like domain-containing protein, partial [Acidobacteriaceae bacterium]
VLPQGVVIQKRDIPGASQDGGTKKVFELTIKDIPPKQDEDYMPPIRSFSYRVLFNYTPYSSIADYWKASGKHWSKNADSFIGPNGNLTTATQGIIAGAATNEQKLRKIYAAVMELENTEYTREHDRTEDKAAGLGKVNNASDVLARKRGNPTQLTYLFIGMARAAGMKAYAMVVPDRSSDLFTPGWQNFDQFDNTVAIVNVDGKEQYFDPGQRYCEYGHLAWQNTLDQGLRQSENGPTFGGTPGEAYVNNRTTRVANLTMDEHQELTGKIDVAFTGDQALHWRQQALKGDKESIDHSLTVMLEKVVPKTLEVKIKEIKNLTDYDHPLAVTYEVKGNLGTPTGKRIVMPVDLFVAGQTAKFPHEKRELAVYFHYPETIQDAVRVNLPSTMTTEATPEPTKFGFNKIAMYNITFDKDAKSVTVRRDFIFNDILIGPKDYADLRKFYTQLESKDQESVVLRAAPVASASATPAGN